MNPRAFPVGEEEGLVPPNRSTDGGAELILLIRRSLLFGRVQEKIVRIQGGIAEEFVHIPMKLIAPRFQGGVHHPACAAAELNVIIARLQLEFGERIDRGLNGLSALILEVGGVGVVVSAIEREIVLRGAVPIDTENALGTLLKRRAGSVNASR